MTLALQEAKRAAEIDEVPIGAVVVKDDEGPHPPNPAELLSTEKMKRLMDTLLQLYDYVIYDSPPGHRRNRRHRFIPPGGRDDPDPGLRQGNPGGGRLCQGAAGEGPGQHYRGDYQRRAHQQEAIPVLLLLLCRRKKIGSKGIISKYD